MVNTKHNSIKDMINVLQSLRGRSKLDFYQKLSNYFDEMNYRRQKSTFQFEEDPFTKNAERISKTHHQVLLFMKFLQIRPLLKSMNFNFFICIIEPLKIEMIKKLQLSNMKVIIVNMII